MILLTLSLFIRQRSLLSSILIFMLTTPLIPIPSVHLPYARVNKHLHSFFPSTGELWNSLPESVFPSSFLRLERIEERSINTPNLTSFIWLLSIFIRESVIQVGHFNYFLFAFCRFSKCIKKSDSTKKKKIQN